MFIESFLTKIVAILFKKAAIAGGLKALATAVEVYSVFDTLHDLATCVDSTNDCADLGLCAVNVISDPMSDAVIERLTGVGSERFVVEKTQSGLYIASSLVPAFRPQGIHFPEVRIESAPRVVIAPAHRVKVR